MFAYLFAMVGESGGGANPDGQDDSTTVDDQSLVTPGESGEGGGGAGDSPPPAAPKGGPDTTVHADAYAGFDPEIHATDENGNPILTARGKLAKKRGPRRASSASADSVLTDAAAPTPGNAPSISPAVFRQAGVAAATMTHATCGMLLGPAWFLEPKAEEFKSMASAYEGYFKAHGITDIPPGWFLALVLTSYAAPRFQHPETVTRMQRIGLGLRNAWVRVREWRKRRSS